MSKLMTTPAGAAYYPHVNEPDTKFDANGKYTCDILVSKRDVAEFLATCNDLYEDKYAEKCAEIKKAGKKKMPKQADMPVTESDDDENLYVIKCRRPAKVTSKKDGKVYEFNVKLFDTKGKPTTVNVGSGSEVKCSVEPFFWMSPTLGFGMSLRLQAVQVIELVEYSGGGAGDFGFAEEDGSFTTEGEDLNEAMSEGDSNGDF